MNFRGTLLVFVLLLGIGSNGSLSAAQRPNQGKKGSPAKKTASPSASPSLSPSPSPAPSPVSSTSAQEYRVALDPSKGSIEFIALGRPNMLRINGKASGAEGQFVWKGDLVSGEAKFKLEGLDTGIALRTRHMKEKYLEVATYPEARLVLTEFRVPAGFSSGKKVEDVPFQGKLTLHGKEKPVSGKAMIEKKGEELSVNAGFTVKTGEFGIATPSFAGITMAEDVEVKVQFSSALTQSK